MFLSTPALYTAFPVKLLFSVSLGVPGKYTTDNSPVSSPKASVKTKSKHRCELALCSVGMMAAAVALGADLGRCSKDSRPELRRLSSKTDKHKSPNSRRRHEVGNNRRSWFSSVSTEDSGVTNSNSTGPVTNPRDQDITGRGPNKRPLSSPVLLKATFFRDSERPTTFIEPNCVRGRSSSTTSPPMSPDPLDQELIDLRSERRDRRSKSMDSTELNRINISNDSFSNSSDSLSTKTVVNCKRYSQELAELEIYKLPPPPFSPRGTSSPRPDSNSTEPPPATRFSFPVAEPQGAARPRPRPWQDSLSPSPSSSDQSPTSEQDKLTLLDVHMEGESHDKTQPLLKSDTVIKMPTFEELEKEFGNR